MTFYRTEFEGQFECTENTEKYIDKELDNGKSITYNYTSSSLSSLVNNLSEGLHSDRCTDCKSCLDNMVFKDYQLIVSCFVCKKNYEKVINKKQIKRFANIYEFCNGDINKFILLLRKDVYPYEYMDSLERFDEKPMPDKEAF